MAQVLVIYPSGPNFKLDYYLKVHMPVVMSSWGPLGLKGYKVATFQQGAPYQLQTTLEWESVEAFDKASSSESASKIFDDAKNFYEGAPVFLKGPIVASEAISS